MSTKFEYTTLAHRYTARFPVLTYVGTQMNFWIIANTLLFAVLHMHSRIINEVFTVPVSERLGTPWLLAIVLGLFYGVILGLIGYYLDKNIFRKSALGKIILLKTLTSLTVLILILLALRYVFFDSLTADVRMTDDAWKSFFWLLVIYYFFMTLLISFINQVNRKYGPGILLPLLLGHYREPKEEDRIFMFMDLTASTSLAEELGHLNYSSFIRDCFADINEILYDYQAQVYQYVGDEIVVTWPESEGITNHYCIAFYFACRKRFQDRTAYYLSNYGHVPHFKAGAHTGTVTAVEIGELKRDIAYHGDILNTAARIRSLCSDFDSSFIVSRELLDKTGKHPNIKTRELGDVVLKGKTTGATLIAIDWAGTA